MRNPAGRLTTPQDVAKAIAALMSDQTHWITGNVIRLDGGEDIVT
jgi:NAD(P)-dependent dehydrogenase (short-subunit alcohol dehydrogenase family)